jgi:hypothetical protein
VNTKGAISLSLQEEDKKKRERRRPECTALRYSKIRGKYGIGLEVNYVTVL